MTTSNTQRGTEMVTVRNYAGNYTVLALGGESKPNSTYEVERHEVDPEWRSQIGCDVRWNVRRWDEECAHDSFDTLRDAKAAIAFWVAS